MWFSGSTCQCGNLVLVHLCLDGIFSGMLVFGIAGHSVCARWRSEVRHAQLGGEGVVRFGAAGQVVWERPCRIGLGLYAVDA